MYQVRNGPVGMISDVPVWESDQNGLNIAQGTWNKLGMLYFIATWKYF
jgi:hypothetical protein